MAKTTIYVNLVMPKTRMCCIPKLSSEMIDIILSKRKTLFFVEILSAAKIDESKAWGPVGGHTNVANDLNVCAVYNFSMQCIYQGN
jgi:hypothetical protein